MSQLEDYDPEVYIMLDISTVITFISDVINDPDIADRFPDREYKYPSNGRVRFEILDEKKDPVVSKLSKILENKKLLMCQTAKDKLDRIVFKFGSHRERNNCTKFMEKVKIIPDCPSERFTNLDPKKYPIYLRKIFGTADYHELVLVTGYIKGVRQINEIGFNDFESIPHRSRNIVGNRPSGDDVKF